MRARTVTALLCGMVLLVACGDEPAPTVDGPDSEPSEATDDDTEDAVDDEAAAAGLEDEVAAARDQLAADTGVDPDGIEVVTAETVTWPDGAIGCPEDGMMYTQALVDGYRIVLVADGDEVAFHGEDGQAPFRCDDPQPPAG